MKIRTKKLAEMKMLRKGRNEKGKKIKIKITFDLVKRNKYTSYVIVTVKSPELLEGAVLRYSSKLYYYYSDSVFIAEPFEKECIYCHSAVRWAIGCIKNLKMKK